MYALCLVGICGRGVCPSHLDYHAPATSPPLPPPHSFAKAERTVHDALDFAERALGDLCAEALPATELEIYRWTGELVLFPLDVTTGKPAALVHESLQDADWKPLKPGACGLLRVASTPLAA